MQHKEFYETFCKPQFSQIGKDVKTILNILKGKNGEPGLCDEVRELKKIHTKQKERHSWLTKVFIGAVIIQLVIIFKDAVLAKITAP